MARTNSLSLLALDDPLLAHVLSQGTVASIGRATATCRRLRALSNTALVLCDSHCWADALPSSHQIGLPDRRRAAALAISADTVVFGDGDDLLLVRAQTPGSPPNPPVVLREASACTQAACGEVALAVQRRADDPRRGTVAVAPRPSSGHTRNTKVRCATTSGRSLRSIRVGGALTALTAGEGLVVTSRRGCGMVQLWHAESGAPIAQLAAHADGATVRFLPCVADSSRQLAQLTTPE